MNILMDFLKLFGINVNINENTSPFLILLCCILVLNIIGLLCFINFLLYFVVIYITEHKILLDKISDKPYLLKVLNIYKKMRFSYLIFDISLFFISIGSVIWLCSRIIFSGAL